MLAFVAFSIDVGDAACCFGFDSLSVASLTLSLSLNVVVWFVGDFLVAAGDVGLATRE
jgi:hypothetical protein